MNRVRRSKASKSRNGSFLWQAVDRFTAFIYSIFIFGRFGEHLSSENTYSKRSFIAGLFSARKRSAARRVSFEISDSLGRTVVFRAFTAMRTFIAFLKLNVYGTFFTFYGLTASLVYFITMLISGQNILRFENLSLIISSLTIMICALPLLFSSQTATGAIAKSRFARGFVLRFLDIPEEKFKSSKAYGGKEKIFFAVLSGILLGGCAYFVNPWYLPIAFACAIGLFVIFVNPETGVILTITAIPFLQLAGVMREGLVTMILITSASYVCKLAQKRRNVSVSPEICMVLLFCAFIVAGSIFAAGGAPVMWDALTYVVIILGGFFLTYNLISSEKAIRICTKTMILMLVLCAVGGIWNGFYNGISHRLSDPVTQHLSGMSQVDVMAMFDNGWGFGIMAVLIFPLMFAYVTKQKSAKGVASLLICCVVVLISSWMNTRYEIVIALLLETVLFWLLYSHKSLTAILIAGVPVAILVLLYPYAVSSWHWPDFTKLLTQYMPASSQSSAVNTEAARVVLDMIFGENIFGIGAGDQAIRAVLPGFMSALPYTDIYSASVWLQILCWTGVFGSVCFVVFIGFIIKRSFRCFARSYQMEYQGVGIALFCAIMTSLILGTVSNIWMNEGMMYLFWINVGLLLSQIRNADNEREKRIAEFENSNDSSDTELIFYK